MTITKATSTIHTQPLAGRKIEYIVIHYTAGTTSKAGAAVNTANYYKTTTTEVSSDYTVDDAGAVLYNPDIKNRYTWHCGGSRYNTKGGAYYGKCKNANSIGIEVCSTNTTGKMQAANASTYSFSAAAIANAAELTKQLMQEYGIAADHVIRHYDVTGKLCPGIKGWNAESGSESAWNDFKGKLSGAAASAQSSAATKWRTDWKQGEAVQIADQAQLFANESTATPSSRLRGGTYYIYDGKICKNGRYRITTRADYCGKAPAGKYVTGYVSIDKMS
ncbi:MAG: N-acetylmuramoyl-L-alanine amidase family protein [Ruminococcus sp.]